MAPVGQRRKPVDRNASARYYGMVATEYLVPADIKAKYHVKEWRNAAGILTTSCPDEWNDILAVLRGFRLLRSEIVVGGGNRSLISRRIDGAFYGKGWEEKAFATSITVDNHIFESPTHAVDCLRRGVALEVEWNNKDPFFDRDLNNFRLLFELRAIEVGIIITRASELQDVFKDLKKGTSYGAATTHHGKLWPKLDGGGGGGCPVLTFAIKRDLYEDDGDAAVQDLKGRIAAAKAAKKKRGKLSASEAYLADIDENAED
jgi:hypothetical protein